MTPTIDIAGVLLAELKVLREKHRQFQDRVKTADEATRECDEEARQQNVALKDRIVLLESQLKQAKEAIEVTRVAVVESLS